MLPGLVASAGPSSSTAGQDPGLPGALEWLDGTNYPGVGLVGSVGGQGEIQMKMPHTLWLVGFCGVFTHRVASCLCPKSF